MPALICGSFAFDSIMVFHDKFKHHILPEKVHILNVSFLVPEMRREFGGCAGNIAYGLKLLGAVPLPMATVGHDFAPYAMWMDHHGIPRDYIRVIDDSFTAQAFITTDMDDNQITAFHPGAMSFSHFNNAADVEGASIGIISPDGRDGMLEHAAQFKELGIPFIFDPGQALPMFSGEDILNFIELSTWMAVNDYESEIVQERTGLSVHELAERLSGLVVTLGAHGSHIYTANKRFEIPAVKPAAVVDPTGCGDAYRAGLLYGLENGMDWETTGRTASLMGALKIEHHGTQNYAFELDEFQDRFREAFGYKF